MAGSYLKSLQLQKQLQEKAREASKVKADAEERLSAAELLLERCRKVNADTEEVEKLLAEVTAAMSGKDFSLALKKAEEAVERAGKLFAEKIRTILDNAEEVGRLISQAGGEPGAIEQLISDARTALGREDYDGSIALADQTWSVSEKSLHEQYAKVFSKAQQMLLKAKEQGEEVEDFESDLKKTKSLIESQDYKGAISGIMSVIETTSELLRTRLTNELDTIEDNLLSAEDLGIDTERAKGYISKARELLAEHDFEGATSQARRAQGECEKAVSGKLHEQIRALREEVRVLKRHEAEVDSVNSLIDDASHALKSREISDAVRSLDKARAELKDIHFRMVVQSISRSKDQFVLANKLGIDISGAIALLNEARDKLRKGRFEEAINAAEEAEKEIEEALSHFNRAKEGLESLSKLQQELEGIGVEIPKDFQHFRETKEAFSARDFALASDRAEEGMKFLNQLMKESAEKEVGIAEDLVALCMKLGVSVAKSEELLKAAHEHLSEDKLLDTYRAATESLFASRLACHEFVDDKITALDAFLDELSGSFDVTEHRGRIQRARELLNEAGFSEALSILEEIRTNVEQQGAEECKKIIGQAELKVNELEAAGVDASDLRLMISKADEAFGAGQFENATATVKEALKDAEEALTDMAKKSLFALKRAIEEAKRESTDTVKWRGMFKQARDFLAAGEQFPAYQTAKKALDEMEEVSRRRQSLLTNLKRVEELISEAGKSGIDVTPERRLAEEAKGALNSLEMGRSEELLARAEQGLEDSMAMYLAAKMILVLKSSLEFAKRSEISAAEAEHSFDDAKRLMKEREYKKALAIVKTSQQQLSFAFGERAKLEIAGIRSLIADARNVGVDVSRTEKLITKANQELEEQDFETSLKTALLAKGEIDKIKEFSSKSAYEIRVAKELIRDAEAIGIDMGGPRSLLDQAIDSLGGHKYAISFEFSKKTSSQAVEIIRASLRGLFDSLAERISSVERDSASRDGLESLLGEARSAYEGQRFQEAIRLIIRCEQELDRFDLQREIAINSLTMAKKRLEEAAKDNLALGRAKEILSDAERAMQERRFVNVIELSIAIGDEIERLRQLVDDCRQDLSALEERLERLKRVGLEVEKAVKLHEEAEELIQKGSFERSREICIEAEHLLSIELRNIIKDRIAEVETLLDGAVLLGIKEREFRDMLAVAHTSADEGLWDFAFEQVHRIQSMLREALRERLEPLVEEVSSKAALLKKTGIHVGGIMQKVNDARERMTEFEFEEAFRIITDAESALSSIEGLHKEYLDAKYAAESAVSVGKRYGIPTKESDRLLAIAELERESDYASAIELVKEAAESARSSLDDFNPSLDVAVKPGELKQGQPGKLVVEISNKGKALAKDLRLELTGEAVSLESPPQMPQIRGGETKSVELSVMPSRPGESKVTIAVTAKRLFDGKGFEFIASSPVTILPRQPTAKVARATEDAKCSSCNGKIKPGFDIAICNSCKGVGHLACAKRTKRCGSCGATLEF